MEAYGEYNSDHFNVFFFTTLPIFVPNGQFVYFHIKSLIIKLFFFVSMRKFYIAYVQVCVLKVILYFLTQMHTVDMRGFRENSGS